MTENEDGRILWVGTDKHLYQLDLPLPTPGEEYFEPRKNIRSIADFKIFGLHRDHEDALWIDKWEGELMRLTEHSDFPEHLRDGRVQLPRCKPGEPIKWLVADPLGILQMRSAVDIRPVITRGMGEIISLTIGEADSLWSSSRDGLYRLKPNRFNVASFQSKCFPDDIPLRNVTEGLGGSLWFLFHEHVAQWSGYEFTIYHGGTGNLKGISTLAISWAGQVWVGGAFDGDARIPESL